MKRWLLKSGTLVGVGITVLVGGGFVFMKPILPNSYIQPTALALAPDLVGEMIRTRRLELSGGAKEIPWGADGEINLLALGLDARKEGPSGTKTAHCDSIHLVTFKLVDWSIKITSVPRGTYSALPPGGEYQPTDYYLANACAFGGLDYGVAQIEKVIGVKTDYLATVGFSDIYGIARLLRFPTVETLQWLRHRQSFAIGDPQRSHNQAVFIKDIGLKLLKEKELIGPMLHLFYSVVETDLDFQTSQALFYGYAKSQLLEKPELVTLAMIPPHPIEELHFDPNNSQSQISQLLTKLIGKLSPNDLSEKTLTDTQTDLIAYLRAGLADPATVTHIFNDQTWQQVEDQAVRSELEFRILEKYISERLATSSNVITSEITVENNNTTATDGVMASIENLLTDYILEQTILGANEWRERGEKYLASLLLTNGDL